MDRSDEAFFREARSQIRTLNDGLVAVERGDGSATVAELFRVAHSLKGSCRTQGLPEAGELAHAIEDVLDAIRAGEVAPTPDVMDETLAVLDLLEATVRASLTGEQAEGDVEATLAALRSRLETERERPHPDATPAAERAHPDEAWDPADDDLSDDVVEALEATSEFDDIDGLLAEMDDPGETGDGLDGWGLLDESGDAPAEQVEMGVSPRPGEGGERSEAHDQTGTDRRDEAETPEDPSAFFEETKAQLDEQGEIDSLQSDIDAVEFGEFDEDDNYTIEELLDLDPDDAPPGPGESMAGPDADAMAADAEETAANARETRADARESRVYTHEARTDAEPEAGGAGGDSSPASLDPADILGDELDDSPGPSADPLSEEPADPLAEEPADPLSEEPDPLAGESAEPVDGDPTDPLGDESTDSPIDESTDSHVDESTASLADDSAEPPTETAESTAPEPARPNDEKPEPESESAELGDAGPGTGVAEGDDEADETAGFVFGDETADDAASRGQRLADEVVDSSEGETDDEAEVGDEVESGDEVAVGHEVEAADGDEPEVETGVETEDEPEAGTEAESVTDGESGTVPDPDSVPDSVPDLGSLTGDDFDLASDAESDADSAPASGADPEVEAESDAESDADDVPDTDPDALSDPDDVPDPGSVPDADLGVDLSGPDLSGDGLSDPDLPGDDLTGGLDADPGDDPPAEAGMDVSVDEEMAAFESRFDDLLGEGSGEDDEEGTVFRSAVGTIEESRLDAERFPTAGDADAQGAGEFDRLQSMTVDVETADRLLNVAEELSLTHLRLDEAIGPETDDAIREEVANLLGVVTEYRRTVMDVRLLPLETAIDTIPRTVRDVARSQGKEVELVVNDADVELDRSIVDKLRDPLVHLARNAVDHGIEPPSVRESAGKPREGTVEIRAERVGDEVVVELSDDGRGVSLEAVRRQAVEEGVLSWAEAERLSDDEAYDLLFEPGFSTTDEVTDVSGRGVGMDVVRRTVADLNGSVAVESEPGVGTTVRLTVPVSIALTEVLFVEVDDWTFGVPMAVVEQITAAPPVETEDGREVVRRSELDLVGRVPEGVDAGDAYPLVRPRTALDLPGGDEDRDAPSNAATDAPEDSRIVWVRGEAGRVAVRCDRVVASQEVVVRPYGDLLRDVPGVSGATTLGDGEAVNVLDVGSI